MKCPYCGAELPSDTNICEYCDSHVDDFFVKTEKFLTVDEKRLKSTEFLNQKPARINRPIYGSEIKRTYFLMGLLIFPLILAIVFAIVINTVVVKYNSIMILPTILPVIVFFFIFIITALVGTNNINKTKNCISNGKITKAIIVNKRVQYQKNVVRNFITFAYFVNDIKYISVQVVELSAFESVKESDFIDIKVLDDFGVYCY